MRLAARVAIVLAMSDLVKDRSMRESMQESADATLTLLSENQQALASTVIDSAANDGVRQLRRERWTDSRIADAVKRALSKEARKAPTMKAAAA